MWAFNNDPRIDPDLPLEIKSIGIEDVVIDKGYEAGAGNGIIRIKNEHDGIVDVNAILKIIANGKVIYSDSVEEIEIAPNKEVTVDIPFIIPRQTLVDASGYDAVVTFHAVDKLY